MRLFNPPTQLEGSNIRESHVGIKFNAGSELIVGDELGKELLEKYPFLKEIDETYSPDYHDTLIKNPWYKRLWLLITPTSRSGTS